MYLYTIFIRVGLLKRRQLFQAKGIPSEILLITKKAEKEIATDTFFTCANIVI